MPDMIVYTKGEAIHEINWNLTNLTKIRAPARVLWKYEDCQGFQEADRLAKRARRREEIKEGRLDYKKDGQPGNKKLMPLDDIRRRG